MLEQGGYLWQNTLTTLGETEAGFVLAAVAGVLAAVAMVYSVTVERTLYPLLLFAQVIPKIAIAPLFVVWLGFGTPPKIVVAVLMAFFPIVISGVTGLRSVDPELLELVATMDAKPLQACRKIRFPASLPHLQANGNFDTPMLFAGLVIMSLLGVLLFAVVELAEHLLLPWHSSRRRTPVTR